MVITMGRRKGEITFVCKLRGDARSVCLAGDFNKWNPDGTPMVRWRDGSFRTQVKLDPGEHQYKFVVDGQWVNDPDTDQQVTNPFGTVNSVVKIH